MKLCTDTETMTKMLKAIGLAVACWVVIAAAVAGVIFLISTFRSPEIGLLVMVALIILWATAYEIYQGLD